jgi:hypothetical protein
MKITLARPSKSQSGAPFRFVYVDGVRWGHIEQERNGMHGAYYTLHDSNGYRVSQATRLGRSKNVVIFGPKRFLKEEHGIYGGSYIGEAKRRGIDFDLEPRIIKAVARAIAEHNLRSPDSLAEENRKTTEVQRATQQRLDAEEHARFTDRACEAVLAFEALPGLAPRSKLVEEIVKAMRWAQTQ